MTQLLFFVMLAGIVGLSYYLGYRSGFSLNVKEGVKQFIFDMTVSKMAHDHFMIKAQKEAVIFLQHLGYTDVTDHKQMKIPRLPKVEELDEE